MLGNVVTLDFNVTMLAQRTLENVATLDPNVAMLTLPHSGMLRRWILTSRLLIVTSLHWYYNAQERRDVGPERRDVFSCFYEHKCHSSFFVKTGKALTHTCFCRYLEHTARLVPTGLGTPTNLTTVPRATNHQCPPSFGALLSVLLRVSEGSDSLCSE